ncbi:MAG TPA: DUF115 domain-containing protein [bacterium]|nr:DUF115 domain-containing protein [bacterium]
MEQFIARNLNLLKIRPQPVIIPENIPLDRAKSVDTRIDNCPSVVVNLGDREIFLHSKFDPVTDAKRWAETQKLKSSLGIVMVFGFGFGYHIEALLEMRPEINKVFAVEVNADVFKLALASRDLTQLLADNRFHIFAGPYDSINESLNKFISGFPAINRIEDIDVLIHKPSLDAFPDDSEELRAMLEYIRGSSNEREVFREQRENNSIRNREIFEGSPGVNELFGKYESMPMIVAAAGPSLDTSLEIMKRKPGLPAIVAVDSALAPFHKAGIRPSFVITGDPQEKTDLLFRELDIKDESLIFFQTSNPDSVKRFKPENRYAAVSKVGSEEDPFNKGMLFFSGTVLMPAVDFAFRAGADPIILIGADFAFTDTQTHASESRTQGYSGRFGKLREVQDIYGNTVKTSDVLYLYKRDLESFYIKEIKGNTRLINSTAYGAAVFHIPHIDFERLLAGM